LHILRYETFSEIRIAQSAHGTIKYLECFVHMKIHNKLYGGYGEAESTGT